MITKLVCYYYYKLKRSNYLDFVDQGLGIEARFSRNRKHWQPHLKACKDYILNAIHRANKFQVKSACILGAGRLYDVPTADLSKILEKLVLVDADPACIMPWKRLKRPETCTIDWEVVDISSRLEGWTSSLRNYFEVHKRIPPEKLDNEISEHLESLSKLPLKDPWNCSKSDLIISLNILSQIGIYWRDRVFKIITMSYPEFKVDPDLCLPKVYQALENMSALLESEHLDLLARASADNVVMIYDDEFYYYSKAKSHWQTESALAVSGNLELNGYTTSSAKCWLWHIVPQGSENRDHGEIHRVQARHFIKLGAPVSTTPL